MTFGKKNKRRLKARTQDKRTETEYINTVSTTDL
jgi:hypothetical protein